MTSIKQLIKNTEWPYNYSKRTNNKQQCSPDKNIFKNLSQLKWFDLEPKRQQNGHQAGFCGKVY